jgi:type II secretory pathway component GspD/PulD (secretin)
MNRSNFTRIAEVCLILVFLAWPCWGQADPQQKEPQQPASPQTRRSSPFAAILKADTAFPQKPSQVSQPTAESQPLSLEVVTLKFVDAREIGAAFAAMCSRSGGVTVLEKSNSLAIFDTKDNLSNIVAEITKIDKPIPNLVVKTITLKSLDAKAAKAALDKLSSPQGNITVLEKSNSLIIADAKNNLDAILNEAAEIDRPMQGLVVEPITLKFVDAKSAQAALTKLSSEFGNIAIIERTNSLIICDTRNNVDMIRAELEKIDRPTSGLLVRTVSLKFLDAKSLKTVLDKMVTQYGSIAVNEKTNSLIMCDTRENLARMIAEIAGADKTPPQIMVEVVILDVQLNRDDEIGINWDSDIPFSIAYKQDFGTGTSSNMSLFTLASSISDLIHVIQEKRKADIIASPRAMMLSGQTATIQAVEEIPYKEVMDTAQGGASALTSTQFKNVGVTLKVGATIADDNDIFLSVETEHNIKTSVTSAGVPVVDTRKANTSLLLKNGQVVVMGGLRREEKVQQTDQIPILGVLPLIGGLFKNTHFVTNNSELIVLISPHIYSGESISEATMAKYRYIKNKTLPALTQGRQ